MLTGTAGRVVRADPARRGLLYAGTQGGVYVSIDDGAHWAAIGAPLDPTVIVQTIDVSARDPHRIYVSATRGYASSRTASLFVSTDDGAHWTERALTQGDKGPDGAGTRVGLPRRASSANSANSARLTPGARRDGLFDAQSKNLLTRLLYV